MKLKGIFASLCVKPLTQSQRRTMIRTALRRGVPRSRPAWMYLLSKTGARLIGRYSVLRSMPVDPFEVNDIAERYYATRSVSERNTYLAKLGLHEFRPSTKEQ